MNLRQLVEAWQAQSAKCGEAFARACDGINRELDAVGGFATTSADKDGYCRDYSRMKEGFGGGVSKVGDEHFGKITPYLPEVGDRCFALEMAHRETALALTASVLAVREYIATANGVMLSASDAYLFDRLGVAPEHIALAMLKDEARDWARVVETVKRGKSFRVERDDDGRLYLVLLATEGTMTLPMTPENVVRWIQDGAR
jgi:hypothetical protein